MKKTSFFMLFLCGVLAKLFAQQNPTINCTAPGHLSYSPYRLSSVWGYTSGGGVEYALVGVQNGVSIVDVSTPSNPTEVFFIPGNSTSWRELKTWGNYMYVASEQVYEGILIADLSGLPNNVTYQRVYLPVGTDTVRNCHTLFVDESGYLYLSGTNVASGAPLIFNLNLDPIHPPHVGTVGIEYAHDLYVRNDTLWGANSSAGHFSVYNITNKANPIFLAAQPTRLGVTHNVWLSDDSRTLFTTDERPTASVDAYDVSDLTDIRFLDGWQPNDAMIRGTIPHNAHVLNDYVVIAHYAEGVVIVDGKHPDNLVEVATYDTYPDYAQGFRGCWGVYPYFPSGLIAASDINTGLYLLQPNYLRASRLQGTVTAQSSGLPIFDALVEITNRDVIKHTKLDGTYKTGIHSSGTHEIQFRKTGYLPHRQFVQLFNDSILVLNVALQEATPFSFTGLVAEKDIPTQGIPNAQVKMQHSALFYDYDTFCDNSGNFVWNQTLEETYDIIAGKWGYKTNQLQMYVSPTATTPTILLDTAVYDDFTFDFGWTVSGTIDTGAWERTTPNTIYQWAGMMPQQDLANDLGQDCFITGVSQSRSDTGYTTLRSPVFDASRFQDPYLSLYYWFTAFDSTYAITSDSLELWLYDGIDSAKVATYFNGLYRWSDQQLIRIEDHLAKTTTMQVAFKANNCNARNFTEAAIDKFQVAEYLTLTSVEKIEESEKNSVSLHAFPIPFQSFFNVAYNIPTNSKNIDRRLMVYSLLGQLLYEKELEDNNGVLQLSADWPSGVYLLQLAGETTKIVKE